ncbi:hypothetical protein [Pedobacter cryophilus]|uniref:Uncharacterized protein n=1 Tax=Pedobacter cryophilus TaxID=2571271 RepID=A0A4V5NWZ1_9SPHI|nr:hypothetical protein [Pedobacter cryophilus]TKB96940.1 hypothetical protein FA046_12765 [Pedobacter cryophilus]
MVTFSSCGTIGAALSKGERPSFIVNAPKDVVVKLDGKEIDISSEIFAAGGVGNVTNTFYSSAVNVPFKKPITLEISSASTGKTAMVDLKPKNGSVYFWGNLIFAPIVGHVIDGVTDNNKELTPRYIDVASALNNVPFDQWPNQGKLKRIQKSKAKQNVTKTTTFY